jgi:hypothetical protein
MKNFIEFIKENKVMTQEEISSIFIPLIKVIGDVYKKTGEVEAIQSKAGQKIETITSDGKETENTTKEGDWVITNIEGSGEKYIISDDKFKDRYKHEKDDLYMPIGECNALQITKDILNKLDLPKNFKFIAEWKEEMVAKENDYIATTDMENVYRIA